MKQELGKECSWKMGKRPERTAGGNNSGVRRKRIGGEEWNNRKEVKWEGQEAWKKSKGNVSGVREECTVRE